MSWKEQTWSSLFLLLTDAFRTTFFPSITDLYGVSTLPHKAQSVTTMTETTATNEPEGVVLIKYCYIGNYK